MSQYPARLTLSGGVGPFAAGFATVMSLITILSEFRANKLDQSQLFARVESLLGENGENVDDLLSSLQQIHAMSPLPLATFVGLKKHLLAAAAPKTEILSTPPPVPTPASADAPSKEEVAAKQAIGATLAERFKLVEYIGSGGTSRLYKAVDQRKVEASADDPHVAVKILTLPIKDAFEALAVLHRETEGLQQLAHPNIVRVIDCDRDGDLVFMTMEFIRGRTLHKLMRSSRFLGEGRDEVWPIIRGIASAVEFAHSKFVVHGDLTPGNVMITATNEAKVIDFGIARIFGHAPGKANGAANPSPRRSNSKGEIAGFSPSYASPEMLELREPDPRDDIYSLGCLVWELLTGAHPFGRRNAKDARDEGVVLAYNDKLTKNEFAALSHALQFDREKRTATVGQFIEELTVTKKRRLGPYAMAASLVLLAAAITYAFIARSPQTQSPVVQAEAAPKPIAPPVVSPAPTTEAPKPGTVFRDCPTCPLMTVVPAGEFLQGAKAGDAGALPFELPQHRVAIRHAFAASRTEITVGEYAEFAKETGRPAQSCAAYDGAWKQRDDVNWNNAVAQQTALHPVSCVSWQDANDYAKWLSARAGTMYRLPSTSEWEFAARAGSTSDRTWSNDNEACASANLADQSAAKRYPGWTAVGCSDAFVHAAPVGTFAANAFGLHDMLGNVFEWVGDCWNENYEGAPTDGSARRDGDCSQHEMRGGSWFTSPAFTRFGYRNRFANEYRSTSVGFRLVRELTP